MAVAETEAERKARLKKKLAATNRNSSQNLARPPWPAPTKCRRGWGQ